VGAIEVPAAGRAESLAKLRKAGEILVPLANADPKMLRYKRTLSVTYEYPGGGGRRWESEARRWWSSGGLWRLQKEYWPLTRTTLRPVQRVWPI
jgi:hypothetical protein